LQMLEDEGRVDHWRVHWVAAVTLIRAVGHVLHKIDGKDRRVRKVADSFFERWRENVPEHEIFREFIDRERNNVLKEYRFSSSLSDHVPVAVFPSEHFESVERIDEGSQFFELEGAIYRPLLDEYQRGNDARDVLSEAIDWWEIQLEGIDAQVATT
jgi:hypothetical protein